MAYLRTEREFKNLLLVEQPNNDWAQTIMRQFFFSIYSSLLYSKLKDSRDEQIAAIAAKAVKEVAYHVTWTSEWVIRMGDGSAESHTRMENAINELWRYTGEMFVPTEYEQAMSEAGIAPDVAALKDEWMKKITDVFEEATLTMPAQVFMQSGGKQGVHTEQMGYILTELQYLQRTYPGADW